MAAHRRHHPGSLWMIVNILPWSITDSNQFLLYYNEYNIGIIRSLVVPQQVSRVLHAKVLFPLARLFLQQVYLLQHRIHLLLLIFFQQSIELIYLAQTLDWLIGYNLVLTTNLNGLISQHLFFQLIVVLINQVLFLNFLRLDLTIVLTFPRVFVITEKSPCYHQWHKSPMGIRHMFNHIPLYPIHELPKSILSLRNPLPWSHLILWIGSQIA